MGLDKNALLARGKRRVVPVTLADGAVAHVGSWLESDRTGFEFEIKKAGPDSNRFRRLVLVRSIVDEGGNRLFEDSEEDSLGGMDAADAISLFDAAMQLTSLTREEATQLEKK